MESSSTLHPAPGALTVGAFITDEGLEQLARFKYVAGPYTVLDNILNPWWLFVARGVPRWMSPNAVTLVGLTCSLVGLGSVVWIIRGDPAAYIDGHPVFLYVAAAMFAYQTLDAVDGKHARNTNQSTPLGALFDHGCDCVAATGGCMFLEYCSSYPGGEMEEARTSAGLWAFLLPVIAFFAAQWEHLHTHAMPAGGVTEAQYCGIGTMITASFWGPMLFQTDIAPFVPAPLATVLTHLVGGPHGVLLKRVMHFGTTVFASVLIAGSVWRCVRFKSATCLAAFVPIVSLIGLCSMNYTASTGVFITHRILCLTTAGMVMMDLNIRMVVAAVCRFNFPAVQLTMLPLALATLTGFLLPFAGIDKDLSASLHAGLLGLAVTWQICSVLWVSSNTVSRVCGHLNIPFLAALPIKQQ